MILATPLITIACCIAAGLQDPPAPTTKKAPSASASDLATTLEETAQRLSQLVHREKPPEEQVKRAEERYTAALAAFLADPESIEWEHAARCIRVLWRTKCFPGCVAVCELALRRFDATAELHTQLGMCKLAMAQDAPLPVDARRYGAEAAAAFIAARKLGETAPASLFLHQALAGASEYDAALVELDAVCKHPKYADKFEGAVHHGRGLYLLMAGHAVDAVKAFTDSVTAKETAHRDDAVVLVRALALAKRTDEALAKARAAWRDTPTDVHLALLADVLGFAGAADEALVLLRAHAPKREGMSEDDFAEATRSRAALEYLIGLRGKRPPDLRMQLAKWLELAVKVGSVDSLVIQDRDLKVPGANLNDSPLAIGSHLLEQPTNACTWANDVLFLVCVEDNKTWTASALERGLLQRLLPEASVKAVTDKGALVAARRVVAAHLVMEYAEGILTAYRLLDL